MSEPARVPESGYPVRELTRSLWSHFGEYAIIESGMRYLTWILLGVGLAVAAWGEGRSPSIAIILPLLWALAPSRSHAFVLTAAYHMGVIRFLPGYAGTWFSSITMGAGVWLAVGVISGLGWAICWTRSKKPLWVIASTIAALSVTLLPPVAGVLPGHPLVGWGFTMPGTGWLGLAAMFAASAAGVWIVRCRVPVLPRVPKWAVPGMVSLLAIMTATAGMQPGGNGAGKIIARAGAISTHLGGPPPPYSMEVMERVEKIAKATQSLAGGDDGFTTVIFPESVLGIYDPSLYPVLESTLLQKARDAGQTVILGADLQLDGAKWLNSALIFRPDGSSTYLSARQAAPVAMWKPWAQGGHYPSDWLGRNVAPIGGGLTARFMFCYEEYIPMLHLIDEALYDHNVVVAMSNLWPSHGELANHVQAAHTQGMALLFGRRWLRAVNLPK